MSDAYWTPADEINELRAEIERLRATLQAVLIWAEKIDWSECENILPPELMEARRALEARKE